MEKVQLTENMPFGEMITRTIRIVIFDLLFGLPEHRLRIVMQFNDIVDALQHVFAIQCPQIHGMMIGQVIFTADYDLVVDLQFNGSQALGESGV